MYDSNEDFAENFVEDHRGTGRGKRWGLSLLVFFAGLFLVVAAYQVLPAKVQMIGVMILVAYLIFVVPFCVNLIKNGSLEYDYLYLENDLSIDTVYNKSRRKHTLTAHLSHAKAIAPKGSQALLGFEGRKPQVRDFTSGDEGRDVYGIIVEKDGKLVEIFIEETDEMKRLMKLRNRDTFHED